MVVAALQRMWCPEEPAKATGVCEASPTGVTDLPEMAETAGKRFSPVWRYGQSGDPGLFFVIFEGAFSLSLCRAVHFRLTVRPPRRNLVRAVTDRAGAYTIGGLDADLVFELAVIHDGHMATFVKRVDPSAGPAPVAVLAPRTPVDDPARVFRGSVVGPADGRCDWR